MKINRLCVSTGDPNRTLGVLADAVRSFLGLTFILHRLLENIHWAVLNWPGLNADGLGQANRTLFDAYRNVVPEGDISPTPVPFELRMNIDLPKTRDGASEVSCLLQSQNGLTVLVRMSALDRVQFEFSGPQSESTHLALIRVLKGLASPEHRQVFTVYLLCEDNADDREGTAGELLAALNGAAAA